jgi:sterol desaturase/sphingolipid hydroxylase (fatty acid hydroxylase superfamily)
MAEADFGVRDARGEWRPAELVKTPPLFVLPPQPLAFVKWLLGYPGYFFPWAVVYMAIAAATWLWLTPDLAAMQSLEPGWVGFIYLRNIALLTLIAGAWHLRLYVQQAQGRRYKYNARWLNTDSPAFLFSNQLYDNIFWSLASGATIWSTYEVLTLWAYANGWLPYVDWREHPVYCALLFAAVPLLRETHFYLVHRLIHYQPLYRTVHYLHHKNINFGPWSGLAMHPVEHLLYFSGVLIHWIVPSHPLHAIFHLQHAAFTPAQGHAGFDELVVGEDTKIPNHNYIHYLHHRYFKVNYGGDGSVPLDKWFGSFHDGSPAADAAMRARRD